MATRNIRMKLSRILIFVAQRFGTTLRNEAGNKLCRAFVVTWRGNIHLIGLPRTIQLRPVPTIRKRISYWHQSVVWEQAGEPDFPRFDVPVPKTVPAKCCHVIISHLPPSGTSEVFKLWKESDPNSLVLIAYGGTEENFRNLSPSVSSIWVSDPTLRTVDHARERQQYTGVFRAATTWLKENGPDITHVHVVEFDVIPATQHSGAHLVSAIAAEDADMLGYGALDISGTIHPHNSLELANTEFLGFLEATSRREVKTRLLTMLGCSTFWTRECFESISTLSSPRVYLEIGMPTLAHHMGFRVRPMPTQQQRFVTFEGDFTSNIEEFRSQGAWVIHPCKKHWNQPTI